MHESRLRYAPDPGLTCDALLKNTEQLSSLITQQAIDVKTDAKTINIQLDHISNLIDDTLKISESSPKTSYPQYYQDAAARNIKNANDYLMVIFDEYLSRKRIHSIKDLAQLEQIYLKTIDLLTKIESNNCVAVVMVDFSIIYRLFLSQYPQHQTREHIVQLYKLTCDAIQMHSPHNPPPNKLAITDIFEMFARVMHHENPRLARDVLLAALDYSERGYCHEKTATYLCLKGLAANYMKLVDRRFGYINDENADQEIDACYQLAIRFLKRALDFQKNNSLKEIENHDCFTMLSIAYVRIAKHYEYLYAKLEHTELFAHIEHWYSGAIYWAHEAGAKRKAGIAYYHLACHMLRQNKVADACKYWENAMHNLIQDLDAQPITPFRLTAMKTQHQQLIAIPQLINDQHIAVCLQFINDLIALGEELRNKESQRFYRFAQQTNPSAATTPHIQLSSNVLKPSTRR